MCTKVYEIDIRVLYLVTLRYGMKKLVALRKVDCVSF